MSGLPLAGYRVLVTRPLHQSKELVTAIEQAGGQAIQFPVMQIVGRSAGIIETELAAVPDPDIVIFVSTNAVIHGLPAIRTSRAKLAAVGPSTRAAIESAGATVSIEPESTFDSEGLLLHPDLNEVKGKTVLIVRGESGRELLADTLRSRGADVHYLSAYRREIRMAPPGELEALGSNLRRGQIDCITVMSVESLKNLLQQLPPDALPALRNTPLVAPGTRVIQTVMELIPEVKVVVASGPQAGDMLNALIETRHSGQNS